jgi:acyl-CoA dehydrogenase
MHGTARAGDGSTTSTAAMAKWWLTDVQCKVLDECVQLFGGYGYMEEYPIARMYADCPRCRRSTAGRTRVMKEIIARALAGEERNAQRP